MTERGRTVGKHALTGAVAALVGAVATWVAGHATPNAQAAQPGDLAAVRAEQVEQGKILSRLDRRLSRIEGALQARRTMPATAPEE